MSSIQGIRTSRLRNFFAFQRDPLGFMVELLHEGELVSLRTSRTRPTFIVNSPRFIQSILVSQEASFRKGRSSDVLRRTLGDGLLTTEKETHSVQKRYMQPAFYKERIQAYAETVRELTREAADRIRPGQTVALHDELMQLTLAIIAKTMFGADVDELKAELAAAVNDTIERTAKTLFSPLVLPLSYPTPGNRVHRRAIRTLEEMVYAVLDDASRTPEKYRSTLLGMLLDTTDGEGNPLPREEIRDQMMTMLLAGHETTANLLTWVLYSLGREPEVAAELYRELDGLHGTPMSAFEAYRRFTFLPKVVQEALRLYPPAWMILRESEEKVVLHGEAFPAGSTFLISPYAIHRNGEVFEEPLAFRPHRFDGGESAWPRFAYFPFGGGVRGCIGSNFAMMEASLILSGLCRSLHFEPLDDAPAVPEPLVSLRIRGGLRMRAVQR
ncbi:cytochrome P450 [Paenibacillus mucilaginosus]|uniref:FAD-dependent pyridine nucleotide-disulfide oxidoreductase n=2 Tax=Paenibacillus mucilaginosus TaxID=61624 RepID=H6NK91_9BACL|nr:cytochrome P450 [Paenibacillus mucilaginosus]AEI43995.1 FAD-dependent pyridine nucleotide-disulfide oxidoreductase [Paenibacillus mucilaginosus KNP414]AFC31575.1 FAD-dependent pyridine nucleotide-disulfide oxidoreductase [Paenibacillus mucilaginosus 3016]MCG7212514.1 cytochrome P450 [Paenibacillus mucilaginosus]WDM25454.1 cytochrome P450 [Paenibacillus mucilaginosus]WFA20113.1 cytochrome P450 [Paenibacillus mucilaginosus]